MLRKLAKWFFYLLAGITVLLAVAIGLLRIAMTQVPEYRDDIIARVSTAIDGEITFARLDARWRLFGPEIVFHEVRLGERLGDRRIEPLAITELTVGLAASKLIFGGDIEVRRIRLQGTELAIANTEDGWRMQGSTLLPNAQSEVTEQAADSLPDGLVLPIGSRLDLRLVDVRLNYTDVAAARAPVLLDIDSAGVSIDDLELRFDGALRPENDEARLSVLLSGSLAERSVAGIRQGDWQASVEFERISARLLRALLPDDWRLPQEGRADLDADVRLEQGALTAVAVTVDAERLVPPDGGDESRVAGRIEWTRVSDGWLSAVSDFVVGVADRRWPAANVTMRMYETAPSSTFEFEAANVTVYDLPYLASFLPAEPASGLLATQLTGTLRSGSGRIGFAADRPLSQLTLEDVREYELNAAFDGVGVAPGGAWPGGNNLTGELRLADDAGRLRLDSRDATLEIPGVIGRPLSIAQLQGTVVWRHNDSGLSILSDSIVVAAESLRAESSLQITLPADAGTPVVDVQSSWRIDDLSRVGALLPDALLKPKLYAWLSEALPEGRLTDGRLALRGALSEFPFTDGEGEFRVTATAEDVTMVYGRQWPAIEDLRAEVVLDGLRLSTSRNSGRSGGIRFSDANAYFEDLVAGELVVETAGTTTLQAAYAYVGQSPIERLFNGQFDKLQVDGPADYSLALKVPLRALRDFEVEADIGLDGATVGLTVLPHPITEMVGDVRITREGIYASAVTGRLLGEPIVIDSAPDDAAGAPVVRIIGRGTLTAEAIVDQLALPLAGRVSGSTPFEATVLLPRNRLDAPAAERRPLRVNARTGLGGLGIDLPYPVGKVADDVSDVAAELIVADGLEISVRLADRLDVAAKATPGEDGRLRIARMTLHLGEGRALLSSVDGVFIDGTIDRLRLGDWLSLRLTDGSWFTDNLVSAAVAVDELFVFGQKVDAVRASLERSGDAWLVDAQSPAIEGAISIPRDLQSGAPVVLEMRKLHLLEADPQASGDADPTAIPALRVRAESFALGEREFGALDVVVDPVEFGLRTSRLTTTAPSFAISATGAWLIDDADPETARTTLQGTLESSDVKQMMNSLGYAPGIRSSSLVSDFDLAWDGGPSAQFVATLDGEASVRIGNGTLDDLEPGAGRVVGLMSVAELPRRLALDFRDVFQKGFNFDEIVGDFRLVNGDAYTCNLRLTGPSADVGLIGRASLDKRNYNQTAVVSAKVGNTLPAVGAVVAGPQVGAALLLFSQIFKKPLQGMTEVYYQINGGWDEPAIERTDAARFVATSELAGCLVGVDD